MVSTILGLAIIGTIGYFLYRMFTAGKESMVDVIDMTKKDLDVNKDGKINVDDLKIEIKPIEDKVIAEVKKIKAEAKVIEDKVKRVKKVKK